MNYNSIFYLFLLLIKLSCGQIEKVSLTFVIDDTGSMGDDIDQVKYGTNLVFDTVLNTNSSQIENFILVTFNDPDPGRLRTITRNRKEFKDQLESLIVYGGGDCPELSMSGIELALKESLPGSYLYIFTDASAKDVHKLEAVQNLAIKKQSQIVFLLTGECSGDSNDPHFQSYYKLASATSGQVFHIHKHDVEEILNYVAETIKNPKTIVSKTELPPGYGHNFTVPVDAGIKEVVLAGSGTEPKISNVTAPDGSSPELEHLVDLAGAVVVKVPDTKPGNYTVHGGGKSATSFVATAATSINFKHGFSPVKPTSINEAATQPISGQKSHLAIQLITTNNQATLHTVEVKDMDDKVMTEMPLKLINKEKKLYITELFLPPNTLFKITIKGYDRESKTDFKRTSPTAIEPQKPSLEKPKDRAPTVKVAERLIRVELATSLKLSCKINGYPKPDTIWTVKGGAILPSVEYVIESPYAYLNILEIDNITDTNKYTCKATNSLGDASETVTVEILKEIPKINKTTSVIHKRKGEDVDINCSVYKGKPVPRMGWFFKSLNSQEYEQIDGSAESIHLDNLSESQAGSYRCIAVNEIGHDDHVTTVIVEYPPTIRRSKQRITSMEGRSTSLPCYAQGVPRPHVDWFLEGVKIISDRKHHIYRDNSLRFMGSKENTGRFTCVASNPLGDANKTISVDYVAPVSVLPPEQSTFKQKVGDDLTLPCHAEGFPAPTIRWLFYSSKNNSTAKQIWSREVSGSLNLRGLQLEQDGYYVCVARNMETSANITYQVKVYAPPSIENKGMRATKAVVGDIFVRLPCNATGNPKPGITWTKGGYNLAAGTEWYEIKADGTLFIKNVDEMSGGSYVCHANNVFGDDQEMFRVDVKPYPDETTPVKTITLKEGTLANIECDIPHTILDSLRWYKDRRLLRKGELTLSNVRLSDTGTYTCRVSSDLYSKSETVKVVVGSKPYFVSDAELLIDFDEGFVAFLDCKAGGEPVPQVTWFFEDKKLDFLDMEYETMLMSFDQRGRYKCIVSNSFGNISRSFEISSRDCILNIEKDFVKSQPLLLDTHKNWPTLENTNGFLRIAPGENILLHCPGGFRNIPEIEVTATCERDTKFRIGRNTYDYSDFECRNDVELTIRRTGRQCRVEDSEAVKVGYMVGANFLEVFEVCLDKERNAPVEAKHRLRRSLADVEPKNLSVEWYSYDELLPLNLDEIYNCDIQINHISSLLGKWFHSDDKCCFKKRQLINPRDLPAGLAQKAAFSYLNVVPQWSTCNSKNWDALEKRVRALALSSYDEFVVWTGTAGNLELKNSDGGSENVKLEDNNYLQQAAPKYLWKVIQSSDTNSSLAVVQLNIPDLTLMEAYKHMVCEDICRDIPWMKSFNWRSAANGYTFCCTLDQFEKAFGYAGYFGSTNRNVFYGSSYLSTHSLI